MTNEINACKICTYNMHRTHVLCLCTLQIKALHVHMCTQTYREIVGDKLVVKAGADPNCLFDRQLNRIS